MKKIIFLDFDGVLNSELYYKSNRYSEHSKKQKKQLNKNYTFGDIQKLPQLTIKQKLLLYKFDIDPLAIEYLNNLIKDTNAEIVVSSTWRNKGKELLQQILELRGFKGKIIGVTPHGCDCCVRGNEIRKWLQINKLEHKCKYVIFDDDSDMLFWQRENFILIDGYVGLTPSNVYKAKRILNAEV